MTIADIAVIAVVLLSGLIAMSLGVVRVVLGLGGWVGAGLVALYGFAHVRPIARDWIESPLFADAAAGAALFIVSLIVLTAISHIIGRRVNESAFGALNRSLGLVVGLGMGVVVVCGTFLVAVRIFDLPADRDEWPDWLRSARSTPLVERGADALARFIPGEWREGSAGSAPAAEPDGAARAMEQLLQPETKEASPDEKSGYNERERKEMDRLIRSRQ